MSFAAGQSGVACLSDQLLSDFAAGRLPDPALEERLAEHLASCDVCALRLQALPSDPLLELLCAEDPLKPLVESGPLDPDHSLLSTASLRNGDSKQVAREPVSQPPSEDLPVKIGDYFVIRKLGRGGFGDVYLARDRLHERLVAIKVPRPDRFSSRDSRAAFLKEARTVAELDHPHIVSLYDCCELSDGRIIVVMEYIDGTTLKELLQTERINHARAVEIVARIAEALDYAHQRKIWHRDVKPANILLDQEGWPYLTDFGLAIHEHQQRQLREELAGTAPYMSPEQILGRANHLDGRSDIWSLGVILYELLTRHRPFQGSAYEELVQEIPNRTPKAPRFYDATINPDLERICLKCLAPNPADRFATAGELARALRPPPAQASARRRILVLGTAAVLTAATGVASWKWLIPGPRDSHEPLIPPKAMEVELRPLVWDHLEPTDFYKTFPNSSRIAIKSSTYQCCFETHQPRSIRYVLRASGEFQKSLGDAGFALGIHQIGTTPPRYRCTVAFISKDFPNRGIWLNVTMGEIALNESRHMTLRHVSEIGKPQKLDDRSPASFHLRIEVDRERIVSVHYNDRPLLELGTELRQHTIPSESACGIVAMGHVVFHTLICEELSK